MSGCTQSSPKSRQLTPLIVGYLPDTHDINQLRDFLENGSIKNSVNFPECIVAPKQQGHQRLCIVNRNMEGTLSNITAVISCLNVAEMVNKSQGDVAYTVIDIEGEVSDEAILKIGEDTEVLNVRVIS